MRSTAWKFFVLLSALSLEACDSKTGGNSSGSGGNSIVGTATAGTAAGGTATTGGVMGGGLSGAAGASPAGGTAGNTSIAGASGAGGASGSTGNADAAVTGDAGGTVDAAISPGSINDVVPTIGCGTAPPVGTGPFTIATMGTKPAGCADSQCGDWTSNREYSIFLPQNYNPNQAYPLIFAGPGCGGGSANIDRYDNNVNDQVIVIGLKPSVEIQAFNAISPNQGCFDDHEGDDSVDWVFYEDLYDTLASTLCFDRNRVFAGGNNSGATLANELGCKYAGDAMRPIRGVISNQGGLPSQAQYEPTCTDKPMAGFWAHFPEDTYRFPDSKFAINRAISVNHCIPGTSYDNATLINYPIGGGLPDDTCKQIAGCDELMVVCSFPGSSSHQGLLAVTELGGSTFLQSFMASATQ